MSETIVLMYHALYADEAELQSITPEDRPYAVSLQRFRAHLSAVLAAAPGSRGALGNGGTGGSGGSGGTGGTGGYGGNGSNGGRRVLLTFDDGHASNHRLALPELLARDMKAVFFVTSDFVGQRAGFCSTRQIRELSDAGMEVQSHGKTHHFFDTLTDADALREFRDSKRRLETLTGRPVTAISFPGGRCRRRSLALGASAGYERFFGSTPGFNTAAGAASAQVLHRFAIRAGTPQSVIARLAAGDRALAAKLAFAEGAKRWARRALGSRGYHWAYRQWTTRTEAGPPRN